MDYISLIGFGIGSTLGFILVYRNFDLYIRGRNFILFFSGILILGIDIFFAWNTIALSGIEQDQVICELLFHLSFHMTAYNPRYNLLVLAYLLISWAFLGTITNLIIKSKYIDRR
jgi:hypothetical protein